MEQKNFYTLLELNHSASAKEIKAAYRRLAKKYHPDKNQGSYKATAYFREIHLAYSVLSHSDKRKAYDIKSGIFNSHYTENNFSTPGASPYSFAQAATEAQKSARAKSATKNVEDLEYKIDFFPLLISIVAAILLVFFIVWFKM